MYLVLLPLNKDMFLINDEGRAAEVLGINPLIFYFGSVVIYILGIIVGKKFIVCDKNRYWRTFANILILDIAIILTMV